MRCEVEGWLTSHLTEVQLWGKKFTKCCNSGKNGNILDSLCWQFSGLWVWWGKNGERKGLFSVLISKSEKNHYLCDIRILIYYKHTMKKTRDFVAIDFETLQAAAMDYRLYNKLPIQIGMVKYIGGEESGEPFYCFIKPPVETPWSSIAKVGITWKDCEDAEGYDALHSRILEYVGDLPLVAFNYSSEHGAFRDACSYYGLSNPFHKSRFIDPYSQCLMKYRYPTLKYEEESGLAYWVRHFGLADSSFVAHHALHDARMCALLYMHLTETDSEYTLQRKEYNAGWFSPKVEHKDESLFGDPIPEEEVIHPDNPFNRKYICMTGFDCEVENAVNRKLMALGAGRMDTMKKGVDILIASPNSIANYGNPPRGKIKDALKKKIQIMDIEELQGILEDYGVYDGELECMY